ncbi:metallopeptidase TldD-related protein [uncultured Methylibium sp.]|uniref:metallopeptidase TldD-related protein n=1 Tax=uncultured Methylibium sp. TaxID=381093 RepID=UPI0025D496C3|nr:metallopeptidase TldD-related protein [uncultured Methylibium sp.]
MTTLTDRSHFETLAAALCVADGVDRVSLTLNAESSDFLRFNRAALRQATQVLQAQATVAVVRGARRAESSLTLSGDAAQDLRRLQAERAQLTSDLDLIPDDPWLLLPDTATRSERDDAGALPTPDQVIDAVREHAAGRDFVGFYAGGPVVRAYADSLGSRHWHRVESFHFDWCLYQAADKAVKTAYAGTQWSTTEFARRVHEAAARVELLKLDARTLAPGAYRAAFSPAAMNELLGALGWSGFSLKSRRTGVSSLLQLAHGDARLHAGFHLSEATGLGIAPAFTADGFVKPAEVSLVRAGQAADTLNSPRSAREYGLPANGANAEESPDSLSLAPGALPHERLLESLGTGLYVSNLWYLNYSDRQACRMTGMTRFACFWVEDGRLVAPLNVMRFDDGFLRMFGEGLVGLTDRAEIVPESDTYQMRQLGSITTPAAVIEGWKLTL